MLLSAVILPLLATAVVYLLLLWRRQRALFKGLVRQSSAQQTATDLHNTASTSGP